MIGKWGWDTIGEAIVNEWRNLQEQKRADDEFLESIGVDPDSAKSAEILFGPRTVMWSGKHTQDSIKKYLELVMKGENPILAKYRYEDLLSKAFGAEAGGRKSFLKNLYHEFSKPWPEEHVLSNAMHDARMARWIEKVRKSPGMRSIYKSDPGKHHDMMTRMAGRDLQPNTLEEILRVIDNFTGRSSGMNRKLSPLDGPRSLDIVNRIYEKNRFNTQEDY